MPDPWVGPFTITQGFWANHPANDGVSTTAVREVCTIERGWLGKDGSAVARWDGTRERSNGGYGNVIYLMHGTESGRMTEWQSRYAHLASFSPKVEAWFRNPSRPVFFEAGEVIGIEGNTGYVFSSIQMPGGTYFPERGMWQPPSTDLENGRHLHVELIDDGTKTDYRVTLSALTQELDALESAIDLSEGDQDTTRAQIASIRLLVQNWRKEPVAVASVGRAAEYMESIARIIGE